MLHEVTFPSSNQRDIVYGWIYVPAKKIRGIVQIVHGFGEHSRRYLHMITTFLENGYIVAADDHVGHGKTAKSNGGWGDWGDHGYRTMMEDEHLMQILVKELYPDYPYFIYGHSMGSFIVRDYITEYGEELSGVIICGTTGHFRHASEVAELLKEEIKAGNGEEPSKEYTRMLLGWMCERCDNVVYGNEWICGDPYVYSDSASDPLGGHGKLLKNKSLYDFTQMMLMIEGEKWAERVPENLRVYNIGGDQDPVGEYGKGIREVEDWLIKTGHCVKTKIYPGYRHEVHNYESIKKEVEDGIVDFMNDCISSIK